MKKKKIKRVPALALSLVIAFSLTVLPVYAAEMEAGVANLTVNSSKVGFAGYEWWVIGDGTNGVYPQTDHITLLSAKADFGDSAFRSSDNYDYISQKNEYAGSTLQQQMVTIANSFPTKEQNVITARDLTADDEIAGQGINGQKLWPISVKEWETIYGNGDAQNKAVLYYNTSSPYWWFRTPIYYKTEEAQLGYYAGTETYYDYAYNVYAVRPALSLNLKSVLFTSAASSSGKSTMVGGSLTSMETISSSDTVKLTMYDDSQTLTVNATEEQSTQTGSMLYFTYEGATTGPNQYISCVLTDENDAVKYYAKLTDSSSAESGNLSISLAGVEAGTYTLKIFSEQANDYLYTDFCSEPVTMMVTVSGGSGEVSEFDGNLVDDQSTDEKDNSQTTSTVENPKTSDNILLYFVLGAVSIIGLISIGIYSRKYMKNKTR